MRCFWERGFSAASVTALEEAAGVNRRQLFRDYGNKHALFLQALDDFTVFAGDLYLVPMEHADSGLADIQSTLRALAALPSLPSGCLGCLVCNTSSEALVQSDSEVAGKVRAFFHRIEAAYLRALTQAAERGNFKAGQQQLRIAARHLLAIHVSLLILTKSGLPQPVLTDIAEREIATLHDLG